MTQLTDTHQSQTGLLTVEREPDVHQFRKSRTELHLKEPISKLNLGSSSKDLKNKPSNTNSSTGLNKLQSITSESMEMESSIVTSRSQTVTKEKALNDTIEEIKGQQEEYDDRPFDKPEFHFLRNKGLFQLAKKKYNSTNLELPRKQVSDLEMRNIF